jgi:DNA-directed RNA polymerase specialized sigma24 family protein
LFTAKGRLSMRLTQFEDAVPRRDHDRPLRSQAQSTPADMTTLYDRHGAQCFTLALQLLAQDQSAAEDVVHGVFVQAWRSINSITAERGSLHTWFLQTTRSACLDRIRRRTKTPHGAREWMPPGATMFGSGSPNGGPDLTGDQVRTALSSLPNQQKEAIELASLQGLTCDLIAQRTGISVETAQEHLRTGLQSVRAALGAPSPGNAPSVQ